MLHKAISIRTFIGAKNFEQSRSFYRDFGCKEFVISPDMSYFELNSIGFYLQDYYVKKWINNSMVFLEVSDVDYYWHELQQLGLQHKYKHVKLAPIKEYEWGKVCFVHDPSGVLWQIGQFT